MNWGGWSVLLGLVVFIWQAPWWAGLPVALGLAWLWRTSYPR